MNQTVITITHTNPDDAADTSELTLKLGKVSDAKRASIDGDFLGVVASWNKAASDAAKS